MYLVDEKTGRQTGGLSDSQVDDIVRFIKTVSGVNHYVQEVDGTSPPEVLVHTGRYRDGLAIYCTSRNAPVDGWF